MRRYAASLAKFHAAIFIVCASGCATLFQGTSQSVRVTSMPAGVRVEDTVTGECFTTPAEVLMDRGSAHVLRIQHEGYKPQTVPLRREAIVGWWVLDAFTLGIANAIDAATGALFTIKPGALHVVLEPAERPGGS